MKQIIYFKPVKIAFLKFFINYFVTVKNGENILKILSKLYQVRINQFYTNTGVSRDTNYEISKYFLKFEKLKSY